MMALMPREAGPCSMRTIRLALLSSVVMMPFSTLRGIGHAPEAKREYRNPILYADYSDPDVIRHGREYYLVSSNFHYVPGLPILHSPDLVHWKILANALPRLTFDPKYDMIGGTRYAGGVASMTASASRLSASR